MFVDAVENRAFKFAPQKRRSRHGIETIPSESSRVPMNSESRTHLMKNSPIGPEQVDPAESHQGSTGSPQASLLLAIAPVAQSVSRRASFLRACSSRQPELLTTTLIVLRTFSVLHNCSIICPSLHQDWAEMNSCRSN